ncbi:uracil-DNA glycosylase [Coprinopsis sp. MPI-PUGE-AT-0042]|nr:uracil-DNA glycosylase [Coprinopsis sp. MPI-PUGE-AT-0042]
MPKVDTAETSEGDEMASSVSSTVKAAGGSAATRQATLTSMFSKKAPAKEPAGTRAVSSARKKVLQAQIEAALADMPAEPAQPVASSSTSQITIPLTITLDTLEKDTMDPTWYEALKGEFSKPYFKQLKQFLATETASQTVFPAAENIYSWSRFTPLDKVKVIIVGQDPYHDVGQAHGLSFSVLPPNKPPPSLRNIYKELQNEYPKFMPPQTGDLSPIASQGVLWLNSSLTVRAHKAGSHGKKGWETFTSQVLRTVLARKGGIEGVVFMAWGMPAQKTCAALSIDKKKHLVLQSAHPSPLSANKGFLGNKHFIKANDWLTSTYGADAAIDWMVLSKK